MSCSHEPTRILWLTSTGQAGHRGNAKWRIELPQDMLLNWLQHFIHSFELPQSDYMAMTVYDMASLPRMIIQYSDHDQWKQTSVPSFPTKAASQHQVIWAGIIALALGACESSCCRWHPDWGGVTWYDRKPMMHDIGVFLCKVGKDRAWSNWLNKRVPYGWFSPSHHTNIILSSVGRDTRYERDMWYGIVLSRLVVNFRCVPHGDLGRPGCLRHRSELCHPRFWGVR